MLFDTAQAAATKAIQTTVEIPPFGGITWTTLLMTLANLLLGGIAVAYIKNRPAMKKISTDREANLLEERAEEMAGMRTEIATLKAEQRVDRHDIANLDQCLTYLLDALEINPERVSEIVARVRKMRDQHKLQSSTEKSGIYSGSIHAAGEPR